MFRVKEIPLCPSRLFEVRNSKAVVSVYSKAFQCYGVIDVAEGLGQQGYCNR